MFLTLFIGMAIYAIVIPVVGQIVELICTIIDYAKIKMHLKISKVQQEIENNSTEQNVVSHPIGFQMPTEEELLYDDENE